VITAISVGGGKMEESTKDKIYYIIGSFLEFLFIITIVPIILLYLWIKDKIKKTLDKCR